MEACTCRVPVVQPPWKYPSNSLRLAKKRSHLIPVINSVSAWQTGRQIAIGQSCRRRVVSCQGQCGSNNNNNAPGPGIEFRADSCKEAQNHEPAVQGQLEFWRRIRLALKYCAIACGVGLALTMPFAASASPGHSVFSSPSGFTHGSVTAVQAGWAGMIAGCLHSLLGPDHLVGLAPLTVGRSRYDSAKLGALWGCGHGTGQLIFGVIFFVFKERISDMLPSLARWSGAVVGVTLVVIGLIGWKESQELAREPALAGASHGHFDIKVPGSDTNRFGLATYATGVVYGLQPDALLVVLPALTLPTLLSGVSFLVMFLLGTMVAMGTYTAFIGASCEALESKFINITERLSKIAAVIAISLGVVLLYSGVVGI